MSTNEPKAEEYEQTKMQSQAGCLQWMAAMCGGTGGERAGCCGDADDRPDASTTNRPGAPCRRGTRRPHGNVPGPEMV